MAITVTPNLTDISLCEATTGWAGGDGYLATDADVELQGTFCLSDWINAKLQTVVKYTLASATNLTGRHLYLWVYCSGTVDTKANGGYQIYAETDINNYSYWYVGGNDTHGGGWQLMVCDISATRSEGLGTLNVASITKVGVRFKVLTIGPIKGQTRFNNVFWDAFRHGTGLTITSGATDQIDLEDIFAVDDNKTYKYGVVTKAAGAYVVQGKLIFGDASGTGSVDFVDKSQVVMFPNNDKVSNTLYGLEVVGNATGTTNFVLGEKSGTSGIGGCFVKAAGDQPFSLNFSDTDIDKLGIYGTTFSKGSNVYLPPNATNRELLNCNFDRCGEVDIDTCIVTDTNFISSLSTTLGAIMMDSIIHNLTHCNFIACSRAIRFPSGATGEYNFSYLNFTGNTYDIRNETTGLVTVNVANGNTPTYENISGSTTTVISNPVTTKITVRDIDTNALIENARVFLEAGSGGGLNYMESVTLARSGTTVTVTHTGHGLSTGAMVHIRGANEIEYNGTFTITYIGVDSYSYQLSTTPNTPATGTITSTTALFNTLTNVSGYVSDTRVLNSDQPVVGRARLSTGSTLYKTQPINATINASSGLDITVFLIKDA